MKSSALCAVLALAPTALAAWSKAECDDIKYTSVPGYFMQDDPNTDPNSFDYAQWNFGLLNRTYPTDARFDPHGNKTQWQRFARWVQYLNSNCGSGDDVRYKVVFMGRHGDGYHNAAEAYYGTPAWNCYWAEQNGNATATWADAELTSNGWAQVYKANAYFKSRFEDDGMPYFQSYYSSPLKRCIQTANGTFAPLDLPRSNAFEPTIKELFRESISIHTCDRRSTKTQIRQFAPNFKFEAGFTEDDELWRGTEDLAETSDHQIARSKVVMDEVFTTDDSAWISITSHSGEIRSILVALNHQAFGLSTGQIIPVLVKAELIEPEEPTTTYASWTADPTCKSPPVTSLSPGGCVCSTSTATTLATATITPAAVA